MPPEACSLAEPWDATDAPFVEPALSTHRSLRTPSGLIWGHPARRPRLDTISFRHLSTAKPPAGKGALPLCTPHQGAPGPGEMEVAGYL